MPDFRPLLVSLAVNIGMPALAIQTLTQTGTSLVGATVIASFFPLAELALSALRNRKANVAIPVLSIVILVASAIGALFGNDPRLALVRDSALTSITGLIFLCSLLRPQPLIYSLSRTTMHGATEEQWDERWRTQPAFRRAMRTLTAIWGGGLLFDSLAWIAIVASLPQALAAVVSPLIALAVFAGLILYTIRFAR